MTVYGRNLSVNYFQQQRKQNMNDKKTIDSKPNPPKDMQCVNRKK